MTRPIDTTWYRAAPAGPRVTVITEPRVHPIFSANMHLVLGRDADLLIDSGMGVAPLRPFVDALRPDPARLLICLTTHTHVDHMGAVHEFDHRLVHPIEAADLEHPEPYALDSAAIPDRLHAMFLEAGYPALWPLLIDAVPSPGYDPETYRLRGAAPTGLVQDGEVVDLGDWQAEVLHLPGHSPGQVGLFHHASGTLFGADAIYDGPLIYDGPGTNTTDYAATLRRIAALPLTLVHGGHDPQFDKVRSDAIIAKYLALWEG